MEWSWSETKVVMKNEKSLGYLGYGVFWLFWSWLCCLQKAGCVEIYHFHCFRLLLVSPQPFSSNSLNEFPSSREPEDIWAQNRPSHFTGVLSLLISTYCSYRTILCIPSQAFKCTICGLQGDLPNQLINRKPWHKLWRLTYV